MLRILTDTTVDMPKAWYTDYDIKAIPINIHFGEETFLSGIDINYENFYQIVEDRGVIPKTSQPTPQQFIDFYRKNADPGDTIISIHITSKLSGTYNSALLAKRELEGEFNIFPFDSLTGTIALGFMCREAREYDRNGHSVDAIIQRLEYLRDNNVVVLTLDNLEYAKMSGRVKALQAALASVLNVKPIAVLEDGVLNMVGKVRTRRKSFDHIIEMVYVKVGDKRVIASVVHANDPESGRIVANLLKERINCDEIIVTDLSIGIAANLGIGTVGIVAYPLE